MTLDNAPAMTSASNSTHGIEAAAAVLISSSGSASFDSLLVADLVLSVLQLISLHL